MALIKILILLLSYFYVINSLTCRNETAMCPNGQNMCGQWSGSCRLVCERYYTPVCRMCVVTEYSTICKNTPNFCMLNECPVRFCNSMCLNNTEIISPIAMICCNY